MFGEPKPKRDQVDSLVQLLVNKRDSQGVRLIKKYSREWLLEVFNGELLGTVEQKFKLQEDKGIDIVDFVKILLGLLEHSQEETIYIVLELIELFKAICESQTLKDVVRFRDFTNFIVEVDWSQQECIDNNEDRYTLQPKRMPEPSNFKRLKDESSSRRVTVAESGETGGIREIDLEPPEIHGRNNVGMRRILTDRILTDSTHHKNGEIKKAVYSPSLKMLFTLDALSNYINVYGKDCQFERKIKPAAASEKDNRDLIIINFNFSEKTMRVR